MLNWSNWTGGMAAAAATLSLLGLTGCSQLASNVRREAVEVRSTPPVPPDLPEPRPQIHPLPERAAELPEIPPAAPPSEAARRDALRNQEAESWDEDELAAWVSESEEFFERPCRSVAMQQGMASAARFAEKGKDAAARKAELEIVWPVIIPANVPRLQQAQEPLLLPVPR